MNRSRSFHSSRNNNRNNNYSTPREIKFAPHVQGKPQQVTYATVCEAIQQQVQKSYRFGSDMVASLKQGSMIDLTNLKPTPKVSTKTDAEAKATEQRLFEIEYQEYMRSYIAREDALKENTKKVYALIFSSYCSRTMQQRIEEHPDFTSKIEDDPIALLEAIKVLMHTTVRAQYPYITLLQAEQRFYALKQLEGEDLSVYLKRFKQARDVYKSIAGTKANDEFIEKSAEYQAETDRTKKTEMKEAAFDEKCAILFICNSDQAKYGSVLKGLQSQFSLGNDQFPRTLAAAVDVLSNHRFDPRYQENLKKQRERQAREREEARAGTSFAQRNGGSGTFVCYCCGQQGHSSNTCPDKDRIPKPQWWIKQQLQAWQNANQESERDDASVQSNRSNRTTSSSNRRSEPSNNRNQDSERPPHWALFMLDDDTKSSEVEEMVHKQSTVPQRFTNLKDSIILDTGSTIDATFMNPDFVTDIRVSKNPVRMVTNAGTKPITLEGTVPGFGNVRYDPSHVANIYGFHNLAQKYHIVYDNSKEDAFIIDTKDAIMKFKSTPEGLYAYTPSEHFIQGVSKQKNMEPPAPTKNEGTNFLVSTVAENRVGYTQRQFENAKRARGFYHKLGCPPMETFKQVIRGNIVGDNPVTIEDANIAERIFGPDVGVLKGRSTRPKPVPVRNDLIDIPPELKIQFGNLSLHFDIMFVNGEGYWSAIASPLRKRFIVHIQNRTKKELYRALDKCLRELNKHGAYVKNVHCDNEFKAIMDEVSDDMEIELHYDEDDDENHSITMNCPPAGAHVPEAERNNRAIKEKMRIMHHNLPYKNIPVVMITAMAEMAVMQLNIVPAKHGVSSHYSPHTLLTGEPINYNKHLKYSFGTYVQAFNNNDPTNTMEERTIEAIYLGPIWEKPGGHKLMDLHTGRVITRQKVTEIPVTPTVIKAVEEMAERQGMKGLKIRTRHETRIHPADWIAGVDYEDNDEDDEDEYEDDGNEDYRYDDELDEEEHYDRVDEDEIDELRAEASGRGDRDDANPNGEDEQQEPEEPEDTTENETAASSTEDEESSVPVRRSERQTNRPAKYSQYQAPVSPKSVRFPDSDEMDAAWELEDKHNLEVNERHTVDKVQEYDEADACYLAQTIIEFNQGVTEEGVQFSQQYMFRNGVKKFGKRGEEAASKELDQLYRRNCFTPLDVSTLTPSEKEKAQEGLMFLSEKRDGSIKGRMVYNGKPTREWLSREDAASPTVTTESIMLTAVIDAKEGRDVMSGDIPNAFVQTPMPELKEGDERVILKVTGMLVDLMVAMAPELYGPYVVFENGQKVLYLQLLLALYGMLIAALLWYRKFSGDLKSIGFEMNPYDPCVANRIISGSQQTVKFHVDDLMSSHKKPSVNDDFDKWLNEMYGQHGAVKCIRGKVHDYLGMTFDFSEPGIVKIDMIDYITSLVDEGPIKLGPNDTAPTPALEDLYAEGNGKKLDKERAELYHTTVAKALWASKRARPDIGQGIASLCTRVRGPNENDWDKMVRLLKFLNGTKKDKLILSADDLRVIKWYVDAAFAVHPDFKSHTGAAMTFGRGAVQSVSRKQKLNTRSSTEAELVASDDLSVMILWTKLFMEAQGYKIEKNILYQDNKSTILLETNGKRSSSKRTRALNIRYFFLTDQVEKGNLLIEYCPTKEMIGDYMTKPLQGHLFKKFRDLIMGYTFVPP